MRRIAISLPAIAFLAIALLAQSPLLLTGSNAAPNPTQRSVACHGVGAHTGRLYRTLFNREPDAGGLSYWVGERLKGSNSEDVAYWMMQSGEYQNLYGAMSDSEFIDAIYRNLLDRPADPGGHAYWVGLIGRHGRHSVVSWITQSEEFSAAWPYVDSTMCPKAAHLGLTEVRPGIAVGRSGPTVTVIADRHLVDFWAIDGGPTNVQHVPGDIVVNANWFTPAGSQAPVIANGTISGSADSTERGQIVAFAPGCDGYDGPLLHHVWMGEVFQHHRCMTQAVSGVSLVHKGQRADAYPGFNITTGYTNTNPAHSFFGFNDNEYFIITTTGMTASELADYAISLGAWEGVMLDGGGSTQIKTPEHSITTERPVTAFAVLDSRY